MDKNLIDQFQVALVGYGYASKTFHAPLITSVAGLTLATVVSSDKTKVNKDWPTVSVAADAEQVFTDPRIDLVVIATPNDTHFELGKRALEAGKHVVIDKPMTVNVGEAIQLADLAKDRDLLLSCFQNRRWDSDFLTVRKLIEGHRFGDVLYFESHFDRYRPKVQQRWRESPGPGGGLWFDLGSHLSDQVLQLFGTPDSIYADLASQREGTAAVDYFHVLLQYGKRRVVLHGSSMVVGPSPRFVVHGSEATFVKQGFDTQEDALKRGKRPGEPGWGADNTDGTLTTPSDGKVHSEAIATAPGNYLTYYEQIRNALRGAGPNPVTADQAIATITILELAAKSSDTGKRLPFAFVT